MTSSSLYSSRGKLLDLHSKSKSSKFTKQKSPERDAQGQAGTAGRLRGSERDNTNWRRLGGMPN
ncbi:hypothetical protein PGTUg99_011825 [Puccinia graminis f. sp. tritici]|uniref:Uncharacterized protein n=1 Tax=Puccinia graminis f. sp. tritici TaxID=56615 RepID=A0A5B0M9M2_PUCGR|nr:hypothetical protein PGTUg99_011825 [Puccinia graminis f. sp. tritici]